MDKRAQGLPISTIILAILGLVVLVILFAVTTGRLSIFSRGVSECSGTCKGEYATSGISGLPNAIVTTVDGKCDTAFEKQLIGNYVRAGQAADTASKDIVKCSSCCIAIA